MKKKRETKSKEHLRGERVGIIYLAGVVILYWMFSHFSMRPGEGQDTAATGWPQKCPGLVLQSFCKVVQKDNVWTHPTQSSSSESLLSFDPGGLSTILTLKKGATHRYQSVLRSFLKCLSYFTILLCSNIHFKNPYLTKRTVWSFLARWDRRSPRYLGGCEWEKCWDNNRKEGSSFDMFGLYSTFLLKVKPVPSTSENHL